jgi:hypothetical protein
MEIKSRIAIKKVIPPNTPHTFFMQNQSKVFKCRLFSNAASLALRGKIGAGKSVAPWIVFVQPTIAMAKSAKPSEATRQVVETKRK